MGLVRRNSRESGGPQHTSRAHVARLAVALVLGLVLVPVLASAIAAATDGVTATATELRRESAGIVVARGDVGAVAGAKPANQSKGFEASASATAKPAPHRAPGSSPRALRLISLNPSLTAIAFRLGAGDAIIGIDDYSATVVPESADRPKVGGLFDPSLEAVVALHPDRVLVVAGIDQQSHADRLSKLGLEVEVYQNERLDQVLENIERLGRLLGREREATKRIEEIRAMRDAVGRATAGLDRPETIAIVDRSPLYLVGGETFLDEMLEAVGARNLGRGLAAGYPRGSIEWLIAARPELLLDMTPGAESAAAFWSRWPSLPAVAAGRALTVEASRVSLPGPDLDAALRELAIVVHGEDVASAIDRALEAAQEAPQGGARTAVPAERAR